VLWGINTAGPTTLDGGPVDDFNIFILKDSSITLKNQPRDGYPLPVLTQPKLGMKCIKQLACRFESQNTSSAPSKP
jgi:hypothetical protein